MQTSPPTDQNSLHQLAAHFGVSPGYWDIWGEFREAPETGLRAVLVALGALASAEEDPTSALHRAREAQADEFLPPVVVAVEGQAPGLTLRFSEYVDWDRVQWFLTLEDGAGRRGEFELSTLPVLAEWPRRTGRVLTRELPLPADLPTGYHRLLVQAGSGQVLGELPLIIGPARCYLPPELGERRLWGATAQLYSLRSERNWGIGNLGDLRELVRILGSEGAAVLGLNPLHALFLEQPQRCSPYSPTVRSLLHPLYLDMEAIPDFAECPEAQALVSSAEFQQRLAALRSAEQVDYAGVWAAMQEVLELLYVSFRTRHFGSGSSYGDEFLAFVEQGGNCLRSWARYQMLQEHLRAQDAGIHTWRDWPRKWREPKGEIEDRFIKRNKHRMGFFQYLQWQADRQLGAAAETARESGMSIGLYRDLAVGVDRYGAATYADRSLYALSASAGAPPDPFSLTGQSWGLPPLIPGELRRQGYSPFIELLRDNMRHAGALRIDHMMGLFRLFWVPEGLTPAEGAYVGYPFEDLLTILALESQRQRCLVIGEDLGTVPPEVREGMARCGILSTRVLLFEKHRVGSFKLPSEYPEGAAVVAATHDTPTLRGFWEGRDITVREELGLFPDEASLAQARAERPHDRAGLLWDLKTEGLLPDEITDTGNPPQELTPALRDALHTYLARTPSCLALFQLEDALGVAEQANLPGTVDEYPNWRRKLPRSLADLAKDAGLSKVCAAFRQER